ncbi:MAG TPA: hypothetical protein VGD24_02240 [Gallionella sp.]
MDIDAVPQEGNRTLGAHRKAVYARGADGRMVIVPSRGSEMDETVTVQAIERMNGLAEAARARALAGRSAPLEYWMYAKRMDVPLLSQVTGLWQWRIRRHFRPEIYAGLSHDVLERYADALGVSIEQLGRLP